MPRTKIRFAALPALLFAGGLAAVFHFGFGLWHLPRYSAAEIEQSVDINLALAARRSDTPPATAQAIEAQRESVREALLGEIARERREWQLGTVVGAFLAALGLASMMALRRRAAK